MPKNYAMKKFIYPILATAILFSCSDAQESTETAEKTETIEVEKPDFETIMFGAPDSVVITANEYKIDGTSPTIVLCHQAQFNKFEYDGVAQRLNENGFNCVAIDQRSGGPIGSMPNETNLDAKEKGKEVSYLDAIQDISSAVDFVSERYNQKVILWGSSYSSSLVLWEAMANENVEAVVSFSPGDYFPELGSLTDSIVSLEKPMFITSGNWEASGITEMLAKKELNNNQVQFIPEEQGHHGSRALWPNQDGGEEYWEAVLDFLNQL